MAYLSLYRRYRPNTFAEIIGQRHVVDGLVHALRDDRLAHAYLFTGPRGTGKTSTARILAKAVNCVNGPTPEPCGTCHECDAITRGTSVDVIELDMASHGGVEDARELRERAVFAPATARRKVYILDEVHMASTAAFNALLKLIEEPPGHVLFAMATTDPQKIPATILSRVQRLDLRRIEPADVRTYLAGIIQNEGATVTDDALDALVDKGDGSIRDTLTLTEQVLAYSANQITEEAVATVLGTTPREYLRHAVDALAARDTGQIITLVNDVAAAGGDLRQFTHDLIGHLRDLLVIHAAPTRTDLIAATQSWHDVLADQREQITGDEALHAARALIACLPEQRQRNPRLVLELTLAGIIQDFACDTAGPTPPVSPATASADAKATTSPAPQPAPSTPKIPKAQVAPPSSPGNDTHAGDHQAPSVDAKEKADWVDDGGALPDAPTSEADDTHEGDHQAPSVDAEEKADWADDGGALPDVPTPKADDTDEAASELPATASVEAEQKADWADDGGAIAEVSTPDVDVTGASPDHQGTPAVDGEAKTEWNKAQRVVNDRTRTAGEVAETFDDAGDDTSTGDQPENLTTDTSQPTVQPDTVDLATVVARWPGVLEILKQQSRRHHAIFDPATPVAFSNNVLTVQYSKRHASFHAVQARNAVLAQALADACETSFGLRPKLDVRVEGEDIRRRPTPPVVTPADAVVADDEPEIRESSETVVEAAPVDPGLVDKILADELDAQPLDGP